MKKNNLFLLFVLLGMLAIGLNWAISSGKMDERERRAMVDTRIDNMAYWVRMAEAGYIPFNPEVRVKPGVYKGSKIKAFSVLTDDSPDVPVTEINSTQSENSIFVDPNDNFTVLNSNNSTQNPVGSLYGANDLYSFDGAESWEGEVEGAGGDNWGDPTTSISLSGRWYVNYIDNSGGMGISFSDNQGGSWTKKTAAQNPGELADKNHMWIDNSPDSPFEGNLYIAWTNFGGSNDGEIGLTYSSDDGLTWSTPVEVSSEATGGGGFCQGVNIQTGPNGEVYVTWIIYDGWPTDESAIAMAKSLDGGVTWEPAKRIIDNIRGIRISGTAKDQRVNSFPVCAVDISNGPDEGAVYVAWTNIGYPGVNTGNDMDIYIIKSTDGGDTWAQPIRVNQDEAGLGHQHYFPWITVDPENGVVSAIFYDDRNVGGADCEVFCANSEDGGQTWEDFRVSDVSFTPAPIAGLAGGYMGDYLGIIARGGWVYPVWTDNRSGVAMTYCSPYQTNPLSRPKDLVGIVTFETGNVDLEWSYLEGENFLNFNIYRDEILIGTATDTVYTDLLPDYGYYTYQVTALYADDLESGATKADIQWGDAHISVSPLSIYQHLTVDSSSMQYITVINTGQLDLIYEISPFVEDANKNEREYCSASSSQIDEYIKRVTVGSIDNVSGGSLYTDFTNLSTNMQPGVSYDITVVNGNPYTQDVLAAWIDWDRNGIFDDGRISFEGSPGDGPYTATISPPIGAISGETRMRIRLGYNEELEPCGITSWGEVEDYTVIIQSWFGIDPISGIVTPGDTTMVAITFDASGVEPGMYSALALFSSNDPDVNEVSVDLTLEVSQINVVASALDDITSTCIGGSIQLIATPYGSYDTTIYSWQTADPDGWKSEEQNPLITPDESGWYFVVLQDTAASATDSIYVTVFPLPDVNLGADTIVCQNGVFTLNAGNSGSTYLWSTGATTQTISINPADFPVGNQTFSVEVTSENMCSKSDSKLVEIRDCTTIDENGTLVGFEVHPNPSNGIFTVSFNSESIQSADLRIINASGIVVFEQKNISIQNTFSTKINLATQPQGIYLIEITDGKQHFSKKLLIRK